MRIWTWVPSIGSELAEFSRRYFFSGSVLAFVLVSAYAWAQFPYDNLCDPVNATTGASGTYLYIDENGVIEPTVVTQDTVVAFCSQSWLDAPVFPFPPTSRLQPPGLTWMTSSQVVLTGIYGLTSLVILVLFVAFYFGSAVWRFVLSWFRGVYRSEGQAQTIDFSSLNVAGYVPQIKRGGFPFPLLACNVDQIDKVRDATVSATGLGPRRLVASRCLSFSLRN